jgi:hypothetical protein
VQIVVKLAFVDQLRMLSVHWLHFDGHLEVGLGVDGLIDLSEGSLVDLADDFEVLPYLL